MKFGLFLASLYNLPIYNPITPRQVNIKPKDKKIEIIKLTQPNKGWELIYILIIWTNRKIDEIIKIINPNAITTLSNLSENEIKLGHALYDIFENYDSIFIGNDNNKFNKNIILLSLREMTNLSTKEIRGSMRKYKNMYYSLIQQMVN